MAGLSSSRLKRRGNFLLTALGLRRKGFFTAYDYLDAMPARPRPYPEVQALFDARRDRFRGFLDAIAADRDKLARTRQGQPRPNWHAHFIPPMDGAAIYTGILRAGPARILEIGSGNSTMFMARAVLDSGLGTRITCIDPAPRVPLDGLQVGFERRVLSESDVPLVDALEPDDVLFVDSSHILQEGFDLDIVLNRMLPRLARGVRVHFHDIFLPDPYPKSWRPFRFNEQNALIGWILSGAFEPIFSSHYALTAMADRARPLLASLPGPDQPRGGSLWLRKT